MKAPKRVYSVMLEVDQLNSLRELADRTKISSSNILRAALREYLAKAKPENNKPPEQAPAKKRPDPFF